jgi:hypothetical protein
MGLPSVVELFTANPELALAVAIVLRIVRAWQSQLTWPEYRAIHRLKRGVFPLIDRSPLGRSLSVVNPKGGREDAEYITTVEGSIKQIVKDLQQAGASLHLINALKRRPATHGDPLTSAHVVWTVDDEGEQVEAFLFRNHDGTVDVYAHTEASVDRPLAHLTATQKDGDAHDVLPTLDTRSV